MLANILVRGLDATTMQIIKQEAANQKISVNALILNFINKGLGVKLTRENTIYHDLDKLAGTWSKNQSNVFNKAIAQFEKIDKELWK